MDFKVCKQPKAVFITICTALVSYETFTISELAKITLDSVYNLHRF